MYKRSFCPFICGECKENCMFYTKSSACYSDNIHRTCLIANSLNNISDRNEELLDNILTTLKSQS